MAQIIASEVFRNRLLADERRRIRYRYTVQDNQSNVSEHIVGPLHRPSNWDVDGNLSVYGDSLLASIQDSEEEGACNPDFSGNSLSIVQNAKYSTDKRIAKKLIRWMMREKDPRIVLWLEPLIVYLEANYTPTQLKNFLDISTEQLQKMNRRIKVILEDPASIKSTKTLLAEFDIEQEEWDE